MSRARPWEDYLERAKGGDISLPEPPPPPPPPPPPSTSPPSSGGGGSSQEQQKPPTVEEMNKRTGGLNYVYDPIKGTVVPRGSESQPIVLPPELVVPSRPKRELDIVISETPGGTVAAPIIRERPPGVSSRSGTTATPEELQQTGRTSKGILSSITGEPLVVELEHPQISRSKQDIIQQRIQIQSQRIIDEYYAQNPKHRKELENYARMIPDVIEKPFIQRKMQQQLKHDNVDVQLQNILFREYEKEGYHLIQTPGEKNSYQIITQQQYDYEQQIKQEKININRRLSGKEGVFGFMAEVSRVGYTMLTPHNLLGSATLGEYFFGEKNKVIGQYARSQVDIKNMMGKYGAVSLYALPYAPGGFGFEATTSVVGGYALSKIGKGASLLGGRLGAGLPGAAGMTGKVVRYGIPAYFMATVPVGVGVDVGLTAGKYGSDPRKAFLNPEMIGKYTGLGVQFAGFGIGARAAAVSKPETRVYNWEKTDNIYRRPGSIIPKKMNIQGTTITVYDVGKNNIKFVSDIIVEPKQTLSPETSFLINRAKQNLRISRDIYQWSGQKIETFYERNQNEALKTLSIEGYDRNKFSKIDSSWNRFIRNEYAQLDLINKPQAPKTKFNKYSKGKEFFRQTTINNLYNNKLFIPFFIQEIKSDVIPSYITIDKIEFGDIKTPTIQNDIIQNKNSHEDIKNDFITGSFFDTDQAQMQESMQRLEQRTRYDTRMQFDSQLSYDYKYRGRGRKPQRPSTKKTVIGKPPGISSEDEEIRKRMQNQQRLLRSGYFEERIYGSGSIKASMGFNAMRQQMKMLRNMGM